MNRRLIAGLALAVCALTSAASATGIIYSYDALGRVVRVEYPSGQAVCYVYDQVGNITAVTTVTVPAPC